MHRTFNIGSSECRRPFRNAVWFLLTFAMVAGLFDCPAVLAGEEPADKPAPDSTATAKEPVAAQAPKSREESLKDSLERMNKLDTLVEGGKASEALPLAKSMITDVDKYIIATFSQEQMISTMPPDVVAAMKSNDAEPLCKLLDKELAENSSGLDNIKALMSIRNNLKRIVSSLSKVK